MEDIMNEKTAILINAILLEVDMQINKFGEQNHPCLDLVLLDKLPQRMTEEYEIPSESRAKAMVDIAVSKNQLTYAHILVEEVSETVSEFDPIKRRAELIQVAAVAINWIKKIDRDLEKTNDLINNDSK